MAKAKKPTVGLDAGEAAILKYLQQQNRPYSATDIFNNLHGQVGKTAVVKGLTSLHERGEISGKAYGKQWVYVARQDILPTPSTEELDQLDAKIEELKAQLTSQKEATKQAQAQLSSLNSSLTNEEMVARISELEKQTVEKELRLNELRNGKIKVDPVEKAEVDKNYEAYSKEWKSRRKMCMEVLNAILENLPQSPSAFMEEIGLEQDPKP